MIVVTGGTGTPSINAWRWNNGFGVKFANPASMPGSLMRGVAIVRKSEAIIGVNTFTSTIHTWQFSDGFGAEISAPPVTGPTRVRVTADGRLVVFGGNPGRSFYWNNGYTTPVDLAQHSVFKCMAISPDGQYAAFSRGLASSAGQVIMTMETVDRCSAWHPSLPIFVRDWTAFRMSSGGVYTLNTFSNPNTPQDMAFHPSGSHLTAAIYSGTVTVNFSANGYGGTSQTFNAPGNELAVAFSPDGQYVLFGTDASPFVYAYTWVNGVGTKISDPSILPPGTVYAIAFAGEMHSLAGSVSIGCSRNGTFAARRGFSAQRSTDTGDAILGAFENNAFDNASHAIRAPASILDIIENILLQGAGAIAATAAAVATKGRPLAASALAAVSAASTQIRRRLLHGAANPAAVAASTVTRRTQMMASADAIAGKLAELTKTRPLTAASSVLFDAAAQFGGPLYFAAQAAISTATLAAATALRSLTSSVATAASGSASTARRRVFQASTALVSQATAATQKARPLIATAQAATAASSSIARRLKVNAVVSAQLTSAAGLTRMRVFLSSTQATLSPLADLNRARILAATAHAAFWTAATAKARRFFAPTVAITFFGATALSRIVRVPRPLAPGAVQSSQRGTGTTSPAQQQTGTSSRDDSGTGTIS